MKVVGYKQPQPIIKAESGKADKPAADGKNKVNGNKPQSDKPAADGK